MIDHTLHVLHQAYGILEYLLIDALMDKTPAPTAIHVGHKVCIVDVTAAKRCGLSQLAAKPETATDNRQRRTQTWVSRCRAPGQCYCACTGGGLTDKDSVFRFPTEFLDDAK